MSTPIPELPVQGSTSWYTHYQSLDSEARKIANKANTTHTHVTNDLTDATTVGKSLVTAASAAAARTALGVTGPLTGTQSFSANGTLVTAKENLVDATSAAVTMTLPAGSAGDMLGVTKTDSTTNVVTLSGSLYGAASTFTLSTRREAIYFVADSSGSWWPVAGYRTKSSMDAAYLTTAETLPAGSVMFVDYNYGTSTWPARPTARTDIKVFWSGPEAGPTVVSSGTGGMIDGKDVHMVRPA